QKLQQQGHEYSLVARGENYQKSTANTYQLNPHIPQEFEQLYQEIQQNTQTPIAKLIHLWGLDAPQSKDLTVETLETSQIWGCGSVVHLLQTLLKNSSIPELWLVTRGSQSVLFNTENHITGLAASPLWGLGRVVSLEHPQLWGGLIDLDPQAPATDETEMLWQLLANQQEEDHLALRGEKTYVARLVNKDTPEFSQGLSLSSDSSYLITGGLGALGLHTAQWLVEKGAKNIVLTGRRPPTEKVSESIKKLEETGCQVRVLLGDVSVEADIGKILEQIQTSMPTLKGIIHAAGVLNDGTIQQMNWERFAQVMSPKLIGTWHLHTLTQNLSLDFFVCFSSIASMLGSPGQGNYAAANAFMDALASYRRSKGLSGLAINWGAWASEGMAASLAVEHQNRMQSSGITEIAPKEGMSALDLLLTQKSATAQVGVAGIQWQVLTESWSGMKTNSLLRELLQQEEWFEKDTRKQKVKGEFLAKLEAASNEKRQEILTEHIREQVAHVLGIGHPESIALETEFFDLGMDSLTSIELKNKLQSSLQCSLSPILAFDYSTINKLVDYLGQQLNLTDTQQEETELRSPDLYENNSSKSSDANARSKIEKYENQNKEPIAIIGYDDEYEEGELTQTNLLLLMEELRRKNVVLWTEGDRLRYRSPKGVLTPTLLAQMKGNKAGIIDFLSQASTSIPTNMSLIQLLDRTKSLLPLSFQQERLWFLDQYEEDSHNYDESLLLNFNGVLDFHALDRALRTLLERHEALRTNFVVDDQSDKPIPYQKIGKAESFVLHQTTIAKDDLHKQ
ncbi:MAG: SDR family NAD(P)-dependent oxidoreductase, partial [Trichodesmium sp. St16_bin2-tuft]|nr:SDR family NAD(P)-dependent oxidoreductase [Trichodesmium sp. St16_bin2-tuft]